MGIALRTLRCPAAAAHLRSSSLPRIVGGGWQCELEADTLQGLDAPYPDESFKGGPRRFPMMIPATPMNPAHRPNTRVWRELANWDKPTMTMIARSLAERGFNPAEFHDQMPGTADQPHQVYDNTGFFLIEENPEEQAQIVIEFMRST